MRRELLQRIRPQIDGERQPFVAGRCACGRLQLLGDRGFPAGEVSRAGGLGLSMQGLRMEQGIGELVGRSEGEFDQGIGELSDAASALDYLQSMHEGASACWVAGFSFGAWIGMQLLMRRPEINGFISVAPPANMYDFSFLAPCPSSGLIINGDADRIVPMEDVVKLSDKLKAQKGITITHQVVPDANHFFEKGMEPMIDTVKTYVQKRMTEGGR